MSVRSFLRKVLPPWSLKQAGGSGDGDAGWRRIGSYGSTSDISTSSLVMPALLWLGKQVSTVPLIVLNGSDQEVSSDSAERLLGMLKQRLVFSMTTDLALHGNAYAEIIRGNDESVVGLSYVAPAWVSPGPWFGITGQVYRGEVTAPYYQVTYPMSVTRTIPAENMLHVAQGIDPEDPTMGLSPLKALMRDLGIDTQSAEMLDKFLGNSALMGLIISPKSISETGSNFDDKKAETASRIIKERFTGTKLGEPAVMGYPVDVTNTVGDFSKLAMQEVRHIAEERVAATIGIPAAVVGYGVGLAQTKVGATLRVMQASAWENAVLPATDAFIAGINEQVIPDIQSDLRLSYKLPRGHVSETSAEVLTKSSIDLYGAGVITLQESREMIGLPADAEGDFKPSGISEPAEVESDEDEAAQDE